MEKIALPATADWINQVPAKHPTVCNLCGGKVIRTTNDRIYGKTYGNGKCYLCTDCGAYVGCHDNGNALGILSKGNTKQLKMRVHHNFDAVWKSEKIFRCNAYMQFAKILGIPTKLCHFGYFNEDLLQASLFVMRDANWFSYVHDMQNKLIQQYGESKGGDTHPQAFN